MTEGQWRPSRAVRRSGGAAGAEARRRGRPRPLAAGTRLEEHLAEKRRLKRHGGGARRGAWRGIRQPGPARGTAGRASGGRHRGGGVVRTSPRAPAGRSGSGR
eukprot:scaffold5520_cov102-Isochrysis_galbana.AAC.9